MLTSKIFWFTGQPGSGKTTLAYLLKCKLESIWLDVTHIDGDDLREIFQNKDYSEVGRRKNIEMAQNIALFMQNKGVTVIVSLVSPYKDQRDEFKKKPGVFEIYTHTTEIRGREEFHVSNYQAPSEDFIDINTGENIDNCLKKITQYKIF